jgi:hypothetical protein
MKEGIKETTVLLMRNREDSVRNQTGWLYVVTVSVSVLSFLSLMQRMQSGDR